MPHQAVIREDRDTTKLRVVYDASSHAENSMSLNDCLDIGPNMYPEILHLLLRFRENRIAITADIQQAFLQISLAEKDRNAVKFLWNDDLDNSEPKALRMTRVIFGAKCSPFLLGATLKVHIEKYQLQYPKEVALLKESLYVDDLITGTDTADEALRFCGIIKDIMKQGNFNMRKWKTNDETVQRIWNSEDDVVDDPSYCKVLGYLWNKSHDTFSLDVKGIEKEIEKCRTEVTKREVLRIIGRLYDPIGFLNPFTIKARILLQEIWNRGILWEAVLPEELLKLWKDWCDEISLISNIEIPRHQFEGIRKKNIQNNIHLHCFCDASQKAYGAVLYLRYEVDGRFHTSFVTSKSRVAPLKKLSIPRLELMGALTGSRLVKYVEKAFKDLKLVKHFWTDSKIILHWIQSDPKKWKPFVKNRVIEIQKNASPETWRHCPGSENPADLLSRGEKIENLENNSLWWTGPEWLKESEENILAPEEIEVDSSECIDEELRKSYKEISTNACITHSTEDLFQIQNYSNLTKIYRITAWCLRYVNNLRNSTKLSGPLAMEEIESAEKYWIKRIQNEHFLEEITNLKKNEPLRPESRIKTLNPFLDDDGIVRVGGRLQNSNLQFRETHPIVLPDKGHFIDLIIMYNHRIVGHGGIADTLCQIREKFWLLRSRKKIKNVLYNCHTCKKFRVKAIEQDMAPLPPDRCREAFPFEITGIDYAGPLYIKDGKDHVKGYVLLFTCAVTRAVHLELTSDMTTETFLLAFRRFIARRGLCKIIFSDNAKTFKTAKKEIDLLNQSMKGAQDYFAQKAIKWKFIIERAAWWGGFWERVVKSIKTCLRRILGRSSLTYRELEAVLLEVEAILNSRPLTFVYSDQAEPEPLTPGHFLIGRRLLSLPSYQTATHTTPTNFQRRWKHQELMTQRLWKVWKHTYLMDLRSAHHNKMIGKGSDLQEGELVLVHEEKLPRLMWKMGRIIKTFVGRDKKVRACAVRLPNGKEIRRPVQLLFPLELNLGKNIRLSGPEDVPAAQQTDRGR